jgi:hypothetical protein
MKHLFTVIGVIFTLSLSGQVVQPAGKMYINTSAGGIVDQYDHVPVEKINSFYLNEEWRNANLYLNTGQYLRDQLIRYDFLTDQVELKDDSRIRIIPGQHLDFFEFSDTVLNVTEMYANFSKFKNHEAPKLGFYKVLISDTVSLLLKNELEAREPTYVAALDVGDRGIKYYTTPKFYAYKKNMLIRIQKSKKVKKEIFGEYYEEMDEYLKKNKISFNEESDLIDLFEHYNMLMKEL